MNEHYENFYEKSDIYFRLLSNEPREYYSEFIDFVKYYLDKDKKIIDIGCGTGQSTYYLSELGYKVTGFDLSSRFINYAKDNFKNLDFIQGDIEKIDLPDESFDAVVSYNTIEHFLSLEKGISEIIRITKKNGLIIIQAPNLLSPKYPINSIRNNGNTFEGKKNLFNLTLIFCRNLFWLSKKRLTKKFSLKYRSPIFNFNYPDNDATSYLNPYDLKLLLNASGCKIVSYQKIDHIAKKSFLKKIGSRFFPDAMGVIRIVALKIF